MIKSYSFLAGDIRAVVNKKMEKYVTSLKVSSPVLEGVIEGFAQNLKDQIYTSKLDMSYQISGMPKEKISLVNKWKDHSARATRQYSVDR